MGWPLSPMSYIVEAAEGDLLLPCCVTLGMSLTFSGLGLPICAEVLSWVSPA